MRRQDIWIRLLIPQMNNPSHRLFLVKNAPLNATLDLVRDCIPLYVYGMVKQAGYWRFVRGDQRIIMKREKEWTISDCLVDGEELRMIPAWFCTYEE